MGAIPPEWRQQRRRLMAGYELNGAKTWISNAPVAYVQQCANLILLLTQSLTQRPLFGVGALQMGWESRGFLIEKVICATRRSTSGLMLFARI